MEKIKDILDNLKDRFSNPLIFSFVCSWLVINWQITVSLLWYDTEQIANTGCNSIFEFINDKINTQDSLFHPLYFALVYTIVMPTIKNLIQALYSWTTKWGENWNLQILDGGKISINKYLKLRADHEKRSKILEDVIDKESTYVDNYNAAKTELLALQNTLNDTSQRLNTNDSYIRQLTDISIINGAWLNNYESAKGQKGTESIYIDRWAYYVVSEFGKREHKFNIRDFYFDNRNDTVFFVKEFVNGEGSSDLVAGRYNINRLKFESKDLLAGTENGTTRIEYRRK